MAEVDNYSLAIIRELCVEQQISLKSLIETLDDARKNAMTYNKLGEEVGPDHLARLKAATMLMNLLQLPTLTKAAALQEARRGKVLEVGDLIARAKQRQLDQEAARGSA